MQMLSCVGNYTQIVWINSDKCTWKKIHALTAKKE